MSSKEFEIKLQFLEEAQEYLDNIETGLLNISKNKISTQQIDGILRCAHSIKGGAAMMGFSLMSDFAHKLEDFFKILKAGKHSPLNSEIESLFLLSVDHLKFLNQKYRQGEEIDPQWIDNEIMPIFTQLHDYFGDPTLEDEAVSLDNDSPEDMAAFLFETEVEGCLQRLESLLANPDALCLKEEFQLVAQELEGLGEMLDMPNFCEFCISIDQAFHEPIIDLKELAQQVLSNLRRCQALVMSYQKELLPNKFEFNSLIKADQTNNNSLQIEDNFYLDNLEAENFDFLPDSSEDYDLKTENQFLSEELRDSCLENNLISAHFNSKLLQDKDENISLETDLESNLQDPLNNSLTKIDLSIEDLDFLPETDLDLSESKLSQENNLDLEFMENSTNLITENHDVSFEEILENVDSKVLNKVTETIPEKQEITLRVPLKNLEALTDLFGELTIERNGLDLNFKSLQNLLKLLKTKVKVLETSNFHLRNTYDQISTPLGVTANNIQPLSLITNPAINNYNSNFDILEMDRYNDLHLLSAEVMETIVKIQEITSDLEIHLEDAQKTGRHLTRTSKLMQNHLTQVRMRPLSDLIDRFPRALREMSLEYGKQVELKVRGAGTLIDRTILDTLSDPLLHLFRNAFDHGIETPQTREKLGKSATGTIEIIGSYRGNQTIITIKDDGAGIDINKIKEKALKFGLNQEELTQSSEKEILDLIFEPGFTTAQRVTDLSGRGVGMDVVRTNLRQIRGEIQVTTEKEKGTTFIITVPFTLSVVRVLLVEIQGILLAFPSNSVEELLLLYPEIIRETAGQKVINLDGYLVPLIELTQWLKFSRFSPSFQSESLPKINQATVLIINYNNNLIAIKVDKYWNEQEVTIRPVEGILKMPSGFTGCTILGDGTVVPLIDAIALINWIYDSENSLKNKPFADYIFPANNDILMKNIEDDQNRENFRRKTILIIDDSINVRRFLALTLEKAGYLVEQAKDGQDGLEKLKSGIKIEGIICDIEMPRLDGYGFLANVKNNPNYQDIPVFMLTSRSGEKHRQIAINLGANGYFSKPFKEQELLQSLASLISY
jgi:two-component system, chemotaxis family, sensor histidine kinase and response regulator PixL